MNHGFFNMTQKVSANPWTGRAPVHQGKRKHSRANPNLKQWWLFFFFSYIRGILHLDWVPEGQTINQVYYKEVLINLREQVRSRPEMWKNDSWVLHHDNALPAHNALSVKMFLMKHKISMLEHPPYSPDLAPCDFFLFPKIKCVLKGTRFESVDAVKAKAKELTNNQKMTCSIASNSGRFTWSGVGIGEGSKLRVTTFLLCNFLNKKWSNISLVIL